MAHQIMLRELKTDPQCATVCFSQAAGSPWTYGLDISEKKKKKIAWYLIAGLAGASMMYSVWNKITGTASINTIDSFHQELAKDLEQKASWGTQSIVIMLY